MPGYIDRKIYMKDKYNCDLLMIECVELVPLYQIIDKLEQSVSPDRIKQAREEIQKLRGCSCSCSDGIIDDVEDIMDKLIAESEM